MDVVAVDGVADVEAHRRFAMHHRVDSRGIDVISSGLDQEGWTPWARTAP